MFQYSIPFDKYIPPDWLLDSENYPSVFFIDVNWTKPQDYHFLPGTKFTETTASPEPTPLDKQGVHGEQTRWVVKHVAKGLKNNQITLVSAERKSNSPTGVKLQSKDLPAALTGVMISIEVGDLVVINAGPGGNSFVCDELIGPLLGKIVVNFGGIIVIAAGNDKDTLLSTSLAPQAVVVGAVDTNGKSQSRYGPDVTCYGVTPYNLPNYDKPVEFQNSSAATAYTAGMVLMMLNYAKSKGRILTSREVGNILQRCSESFDILDSNGKALENGFGLLPNWKKLRPAINELIQLAI